MSDKTLDIKNALDREAIFKLAIDALHMEFQDLESTIYYNELENLGNEKNYQYGADLGKAEAALKDVIKFWGEAEAGQVDHQASTTLDIKNALDREAIFKLAIDALHMEWQQTDSHISYNAHIDYWQAEYANGYLTLVGQARAALQKVVEYWNSGTGLVPAKDE